MLRYLQFVYIILICTSFCNQTLAYEFSAYYTKFNISANDKDIESQIQQAINEADYDCAISYAKDLLEIGNSAKNNTTIYRACYWLSYLYYLKNDIENTLFYVDRGTVIAVSEDKKNKVFPLLLFKSGILMRNGFYEKAIQSYIHAEKYLSDNLEQKLSLKQNLGMCKIRIKRYKDAIQDFIEILKLLEKPNVRNQLSLHNQTAMIFGANNSLGLCYQNLQLYEKAQSYFETNLDIEESPHYSNQIAITHLNIGHVLLDLGQNEKALQSFSTAKTLFIKQKTKDENYLQALFGQAKAHQIQEEYNKAAILFDEIYSLLKNMPTAEKSTDIMKLAINNASLLGDKNREFLYQKLLTNIQEKKFEDLDASKDLIFNRESSSMKQKNKGLLLKNQIKTIIIIFITLSAIGFLFILLGFRKKAKRNKELFTEMELKLNKLKESRAESYHKKEKSTIPKIDDATAYSILQKLERLEEGFFFKNVDCTLHSTAKALKTNTTYLSKIINQYKEQSFNDYINNLRILYVLEQLKNNPKFSSYSIKGIADDVGYKSVNTFNNAFKKVTQISPTYYIKRLQQKQMF